MKMPGMNEEWEDFCERLQWRFPKLTPKDLSYIPGKEEETLQRLQESLGRSRQDLLALFDRMKTI